jgi:DNA-binding CsgD family transcriptional regulator
MRDVFGHIAAFVTDLSARPQPTEKLIGEAFKLSPAEARLACALVNGDELRVAAERVGITYETARAYLKSIFAKADVTRQSELVAVLSAERVWRKDGA